MMMNTSQFACVALLVLGLLLTVQAGVPRYGKFQGALNRGREHKLLERSVQDVPEQWYEAQALDHFLVSDNRTWPQRFFVNDTFWEPQGPVFLLLGGEGPIHSTDVTGHFALSSQAAQFGAMSISLEHRFYGDSQPFGSTATENLRYLTSQQALADAAQFIEWYTSQNSGLSKSKWVVFGGSYSGNLAAWFRLKYPHLVVGAIASSAPVVAQLDYPEYLETVSNSLDAFQPGCSDLFAQAQASIDSLLSQGSSGYKQLETTFNTCDPLGSDKDVATFLGFITDEVAGIVQYNNDNNDYEPMNIDGLCSLMSSSSYASPMEAWAAFISTSLDGDCTPVSYNKQVKEMRITSLFATAARSWYWQTCTEFGYYQTGESANQPFSSRITLQYFLDLCEDTFGLPLTPNTEWINTYYGADDIQGSRIVLPNGSIDPWHVLGVLDRANYQEQNVLMNGTAHVADLYPPRSADVPDLTKVRKLELNRISAWLSRKY